MSNMKYTRDVVFQYTGPDSVPADLTGLVRYDGTNLIIDNKAACLGWYVAYNKIQGDVVDMDSLIIRSPNEWKVKCLLDVEEAGNTFKVAAPVMNPVAGGVSKGSKVSITCSTANSVIYYTVNGSVPSKDTGTKYTGEITINADTTVKAIAYATNPEDGVEASSIVVSATYTVVLPQVAKPAATPSTGSIQAGTKVKLTCATSGAKIYYTTDGSTPSASNGTLYSTEIEPTNGMTLKAIAVLEDHKDSEVLSIKYTITVPTVATPKFSKKGEVESGTVVTITCDTADAKIYYTVDGSTPSASSTEYTTGIEITSAMTIKAIAVKAGYTDSAVASASYTIKQEALKKYIGFFLASDEGMNEEVPFPDVVTEEVLFGLSDLVIEDATDKALGSKGNERTFVFSKKDNYIAQFTYAYPSSLGELTKWTNNNFESDILGSYSLDKATIKGVEYNVYHINNATEFDAVLSMY